MRSKTNFPTNWIVTTEKDIIYFGTGITPKRSVTHSAFVKRGYMKDAVWSNGAYTSPDFPYVVNPEKGFIANANNFIGSARVKTGIGMHRTFVTRNIRISELLEEKIARKDQKITVEEMQQI